MILTCPSCGTQYVVKDGAIPPEGRQVRCAACKHSWHQDAEEAAADRTAEDRHDAASPSVPDQALSGDLAPRTEEAVADDGEESLAEATLIEPRNGPDAEQRAYEETLIEDSAESRSSPSLGTDQDEEERSFAENASPATADWKEPPDSEPAPDMFSPFATDDVVEPRRRGPLAGILIALLLVVVLAAAFWFFAPAALKARLGLAATAATPLQLVTTHMDRQHLESGNDLLTLTGRVINPSAKEQVVPPIQAQLKNKSGQVVYSWTIQPPAPSLAAGASASFNSAEVSVPPGGEELTITLGQTMGRRG